MAAFLGFVKNYKFFIIVIVSILVLAWLGYRANYHSKVISFAADLLDKRVDEVKKEMEAQQAELKRKMEEYEKEYSDERRALEEQAKNLRDQVTALTKKNGELVTRINTLERSRKDAQNRTYTPSELSSSFNNAINIGRSLAAEPGRLSSNLKRGTRVSSPSR